MKRFIFILLALIGLFAMQSQAKSLDRSTPCHFIQCGNIDVGIAIQTVNVIVPMDGINYSYSKLVMNSSCTQTFKGMLVACSGRDVGWQYHNYSLVLDPINNKVKTGTNYKNISRYFCSLS